MVQSRREFIKSTGLVGIGALAGGPSGVRYSRAQPRGSQEVLFAQTPVLNIGYEDNGSSQGFPVILLHGFPYDVRAWDGGVCRPSSTPDTGCSRHTCGATDPRGSATARRHARPSRLQSERT